MKLNVLDMFAILCLVLIFAFGLFILGSVIGLKIAGL